MKLLVEEFLPRLLAADNADVKNASAAEKPEMSIYQDLLPNTQKPNKALQLTPSRLTLLSHDRLSFPSTPSQSLCARSG